MGQVDYNLLRFELRDEIRSEMSQRNLNQAQLADLSGVDRVIINYVVGNNQRNFSRLIRVDVLDKITETFGLPVGYFYKYMVAELYSATENVVQGERVIEFTRRCLENGQEEYIPFQAIEDMIYFVRFRSRYKRMQALKLLDECFEKGYSEKLLPYYEMLVDTCTDRNEEFRAYCLYRRFLIQREKSRKDGLIGMVQFLPSLPYLEGEIKQEAYWKVIMFAYSMNDWDTVLSYARSLEMIALSEHYYGQALLYQSFAHREKGNMCQAFELTERYAAINDYYKSLAVANRLIIKIDMGDFRAVRELLQLSIENNRVYLDLPRLMEAYLKADQLSEIDQILSKHAYEVVRLRKEQGQFEKKYKAKFSYYYAIYLVRKGNIEGGLWEVLEGMKLFDHLHDEVGFKNAVSFFLDCYGHATCEQVEAFKQLFSERSVTCEKTFRIPLLDGESARS